LGLSSVIEPISNVKKDGRALRIVKKKNRKSLPYLLQEAYKNILNDLLVAEHEYEKINSIIILGDGRKLRNDIGERDSAIEDIDLICYSPPYLNNFDYSEIYKMELWANDLIKDSEDFKNLRLKTFRSHPSIKFTQGYTYQENSKLDGFKKIIKQLINSIPDDKYKSRREGLIKGYFDDMYISLKNQYEVMKKGGWLFCVVSNSKHGIPIATDLLIAELANEIGFTIKAIEIARPMGKRVGKSDFLRESIIVIKK